MESLEALQVDESILQQLQQLTQDEIQQVLQQPEIMQQLLGPNWFAIQALMTN